MVSKHRASIAFAGIALIALSSGAVGWSLRGWGDNAVYAQTAEPSLVPLRVSSRGKESLFRLAFRSDGPAALHTPTRGRRAVTAADFGTP